MQIANNCIVSLQYELTNDRGELLDRSPDNTPLVYLHGAAGILPALEAELTGKTSGDHFDLRVAPQDGFGDCRVDLINQVPREALAHIENLTVGMQIQGQNESGSRQFAVVAVDDDSVTLDGNHPLAGMNLRFEGQVVGVQAVTDDDMSNFSHGTDR
ncbi:MAG: peptidylprolyl isomerase [Gammaproteobacteria bacterium]